MITIKQIVPILTVVFLVLGIASYLGLAPAEIVNPPHSQVIYTNAQTTDPNLRLGKFVTQVQAWENDMEYGLSSITIGYEATEIGNQIDQPYYIEFDIYMDYEFNEGPLELEYLDTWYDATVIEGSKIQDSISTFPYDVQMPKAAEGDIVDYTIVIDGYISYTSAGGMALERQLDYIRLAVAHIIIDGGDSPVGYAELNGHVQNAGGTAIPGATVTLGELGTTSDPDGSFQFPSIALGTYNFTVSKTGYQSYFDTMAFETDGASRQKTVTLIGINEDEPDDDLDSDGDGYTDAEEIAAGTDPYDPTDYPGSGGNDNTPDIITLPPRWMIFIIIGVILAIAYVLFLRG